MKSIILPFFFVRSRFDLTWSDVEWGFRNGWFDTSGVVDYAVTWLVEDRKETPAIAELAGITEKELAEDPELNLA
jgi:hypothetical protein